MELRLEEVEAREMKSPEKLGKFEFSIFGSGVAGRGRPYWDEGGRRTVKVGGRTIFFDFVRLKDGSGGRTDNFLSQADRGGRWTGEFVRLKNGFRRRTLKRFQSARKRTDSDGGQINFRSKRTPDGEVRPPQGRIRTVDRHNF